MFEKQDRVNLSQKELLIAMINGDLFTVDGDGFYYFKNNQFYHHRVSNNAFNFCSIANIAKLADSELYSAIRIPWYTRPENIGKLAMFSRNGTHWLGINGATSNSVPFDTLTETHADSAKSLSVSLFLKLKSAVEKGR